MIRTDPSQRPQLSDILIEVLVCPLDHADLEQRDATLVCTLCGRPYPVNDGIPNMLIERD